MRRTATTMLSALTVWVVCVSIAALAQVPPSSIRLQGYLTDRTVIPAVPATGTFPMSFGLWDQASAGSLVQQENVPAVDVVDGLYDVALPFGPSLFDEPRWLEIIVDGEVLSPRLAIGSSPYAYLAGTAQLAESVLTDGVDSAAIQQGAVTLDKIALACSPGEVIVRTDTGWGCLAFTGCLPGETRACYSGPGGTAGVGECVQGIETCQPSGSYGPCDGEVVPVAETCNSLDDDCDGTVDNTPGAPTWYFDSDSDGFGDPGNPVVSCNQPAGTVSNSQDCYDSNANARPNQTQYFPFHRGDGSYDYNCNVAFERQWTGDYTCSSGCSSFDEGWVDPEPACGQTRTYGTGCDAGFPPQCDPDVEADRTQACR